jgi:hypothetical protein
MRTSAGPSTEPATLLDRIVRWVLDLNGPIYGDERERLRRYEGMVTAARLQWLVVPWAATVLVWRLGRPAVLPLSVVLVLFYVPILMCDAYLRRRSVNVDLTPWTVKRVVLAVLLGAPWPLFAVVSVDAYRGGSAILRTVGTTWISVLIGAIVGTVGRVRRQRRLAAADAVAADVD